MNLVFLHLQNKAKVILLIGDFNTRLHARRENENDIYAPFIFGRGIEVLDNQLQHGLTPNRDFSTELLLKILLAPHCLRLGGQR